MILLFFAVCSIARSAHADVALVAQDMILFPMNKDYLIMNECDAGVDEFDDGEWPTAHATLAVQRELPCNMVLRFNTFESKMGQYTHETGVTFTQTLEEFLIDDTLVGPTLQAFNITRCPIKPGRYIMKNYRFESDMLDIFPIGEFLGLTEAWLSNNTDVEDETNKIDILRLEVYILVVDEDY